MGRAEVLRKKNALSFLERCQCPLKWQLQRYSSLSRVPKTLKGAATQQEMTQPHHISCTLVGLTPHTRGSAFQILPLPPTLGQPCLHQGLPCF